MTHDPISQAGHSAAACEHGHSAPQWRRDARWSPCQQAAVRQGKETRCTAGPRAQRQLSVGMRWQCVLMRGIKLQVSEEDMKHAVKNLKENMHDLLESLFENYARQLRADYPEQTIRKAVVFASAIREFARLGYIELVNVRLGIPADIPKALVRTIKRSRHHPIWIPGPGFPDEPWDLFDQMKPSMRGNEVVWRHIPPQKRNTWRRCSVH